MNLSHLQDTLLKVARANPPSEQVPYAFEKRITALLASRKAEDKSIFWSRGLWRAACSCVAIALVLGVWVYLRPAPATSPTADISQDFQNTLTASADQGDSSSSQ